MQDGWGVDSPWGSPHNIAYPFRVKDDGSGLTREETERSFPRCDLMSGNDSHSFGEKPVSHIKVIKRQVGRKPGDMGGRPCSGVYTTWGYSNVYWTHYVDTFLNGFHERVYRHWGSTPQKTDTWYDNTWYCCSKLGQYLRYYNGFGYCSESYGAEYGYDPSGYDPGTSQRYVEDFIEGGFFELTLTPDEALRYYQQLAVNHVPGGGEFSEMFRNAMNSIGYNTNTIANVKEIIDLIRDIKSGRLLSSLSDFSNLKKTAAKAWLGYRYSYNTTKSDIEEYLSKTKKLLNYDATKQHIVRSGISNAAGVFHCKVVYRDTHYNTLTELYKLLKRTGLALDAYNAWDMVPLSFVIDWILPIGDFLEDLSSNWVAQPGMFDIGTITTSFKWTDQIGGYNGAILVSSYMRSVSTEPPEFASYSEDPSTSTVIKRVIDAGALLIS